MPIERTQASQASHGSPSARRRFLHSALAGAGALALARGVFAADEDGPDEGQDDVPNAAPAALPQIPPTQGLRPNPSDQRDQDILNFALNFEYLGAELYLHATTGRGLTDINDIGSDDGPPGETIGGRQVNFATPLIAGLAAELAGDEVAHVRTLRLATRRSIPKPAIDLVNSYTAIARLAGLIGPNQTFDAFANENNFLLAAFSLEDVCVTALKGAAPLLHNKDVLSTAAGFLAVEAYHGGALRTLLFERNLAAQANAISSVRDSVDGTPDDDQGITDANGVLNITPADENAIAFGRTPGQVLAVAYGSPTANRGGFFPDGVNGRIQ